MKLDVHQPKMKAVLSFSDDGVEFAVISLAGVVSGQMAPSGAGCLRWASSIT